MKIKQKIAVIMVVLFLVPLIMFGATYFISQQQKADGLVINLAGRQRMLSQKMSKECLAFTHLTMMKDQQAADKVKKDLQNTVAVFNTTLIALINSGEAPLTMNLDGAKAYLPRANGRAAMQLN